MTDEERGEIEVGKLNPARVIVSVALAVLLAVAVLINLRNNRQKPEPLDLPAASEVTVCYYIPDRTRPYEQMWIGGEKLETMLYWIGRTTYVEADAPDESRFVSCYVIATNEYQIVIHIDDEGTGWVYDQERGWMREQQ